MNQLHLKQLPPTMKRIINTAIEMQRTGYSSASSSEQIAAAFVLNHLYFLPDGYDDVVLAWDKLGYNWQQYVRLIKRDYMHLIEAG